MLDKSKPHTPRVPWNVNRCWQRHVGALIMAGTQARRLLLTVGMYVKCVLVNTKNLIGEHEAGVCGTLGGVPMPCLCAWRTYGCSGFESTHCLWQGLFRETS